MGITIPSIFVSSERVDNNHVMELISRLRQEGFTVFHSPHNPLDGKDARWLTWYESRCREEIGQADVFIIAITPGWDCSTWMGIEAEEARRSLRIRRKCYYNPAHYPVQSENMAQQYLHERLPDKPEEVIAALRKN